MLATALRAQKHAVPRKLFPQSCQSRVSHIISDGRGAINLFKSLLHAYIAERYDVPGVPSDYDGSDSDKAENSFDKYYEKDKPALRQARRSTGWPAPSTGPRLRSWNTTSAPARCLVQRISAE